MSEKYPLEPIVDIEIIPDPNDQKCRLLVIKYEDQKYEAGLPHDLTLDEVALELRRARKWVDEAFSLSIFKYKIVPEKIERVSEDLLKILQPGNKLEYIDSFSGEKIPFIVMQFIEDHCVIKVRGRLFIDPIEKHQRSYDEGRLTLIDASSTRSLRTKNDE